MAWWQAVLATALAYYLTGRLGLLLAVPPGYATVIWPPAGIGVAAVILGGYRVLPGIMLGSLLVNLSVGFEFGTIEAIFRSIVVPACFGAGAALQAAVAAFLTRRFRAFPYDRIAFASIGRFLLIAGPLACLVNSTTADLLLLALKRIEPAELPADWTTWWAGDTIGVFVFAPSILGIALAPPGERRRRALPLALAAFGLSAATLGLVVLETRSSRRAVVAEFSRLTVEVGSRVEATISLGTHAVGGLAGVFETERERNLDDFTAVANRISAFGLGIQALEWIPRVEAGRRAAFERRIGSEWRRDFAITERQAGTLGTAGQRDAYFPVAYVVPLAGNEGALGYDLASNPTRNTALRAAESTGQVVATAAITLVQNGKTGILLFLPVFDPAQHPTDPTTRHEALKGFALGVFSTADLLGVALEGRDLTAVRYWLVDETSPESPRVLAANSAAPAGPLVLAGASLFGGATTIGEHLPFDVGGRKWALWIAPTPRYLALHRNDSAYFLLLGGLLFTALVSSSVLISSDRQYRAVAAREKALEDQKFALDQHAIVSITDPGGTIVYANERFCQVAGYPHERLIGAGHDIVHSGRHPPGFFRAFWETIRAGRVWHGEICNRNASGQYYWLASTIVPLLDAEGRPTQYIAICTDITERKRLEQDLESSRAFLQSVADSMGEGLYTLDAEGRCTFANAEAERLLGWTAAEMKNRSVHDLVHFQDGDGTPIPECECAILLALKDEPKYQSEDHYFTRRDGTVFPVSMVSVRLEENGQYAGAVTVFQDITGRRRIQDALRESEERLKIALEASATGSWDLNPVTDVAVYSDTWFTMLGYRPGAVPGTGDSLQALLHPEDRAPYRAAMRAHVDGFTSAMEVEFRMRRHDGGWAWIKSVGKVIERRADGTPTRLSGVHIDVSQARAAQAELAAAKNLAISASQAKSDFLARMSHEIRTPMNAIIGPLHLLGRTDLSDRQRGYLDTIRTASRTLLGLINDILDFSKIEAGALDVETVPFELDDLVKNLVPIVLARTREKGLELCVDRAPSVPNRLIGDPLRLFQIMTNLLGNAAKFTERGEVVLTIGGAAAAQGGFLLEVAVRDTGIGMSAQEVTQLFRPFTQADASISRRFGGTGLGLAISRQLVTLCGGAIEVESEPGRGSCFRFTMPLELAEPIVAANEMLEPIVGRQVLVFEDNEAASAILCGALQRCGMTVTGFAEAEAVLQRLESDPFVDLIMLDWDSAQPDGAAMLRRIARASVAAPILLTTTQGREMVEPLLAGNGFPTVVAILEKPVLASALRDALKSAFGIVHREAGAEDRLSGGDDVDLPSAEVLLVDDNPINRQIATELLALHGIRVTAAESGEEAIEILRGFHFHLILMDIRMPGLDGYQTTAIIRSELRVTTPIIAMTANALAADRARCLEAGMNDHIGKPIDPEALASTLGRWLDAGGAHRTGRLRMRMPPTKPESALSRDALPGIDLAVAMHNLSDDRDLLMRLLGIFRMDYADVAQTFRSGLAHRDWAALGSLAHRLKGASSSLGATRVAELAASIEFEAGRDVHDAADIDARIDALDVAMAEIFGSSSAGLSQRRAGVGPIDAQAVCAGIDVLSALLAEGNADAETAAERLAGQLADTEYESRAMEIGHLIGRFDFDAALSRLVTLRSALREGVAHDCH